MAKIANLQISNQNLFMGNLIIDASFNLNSLSLFLVFIFFMQLFPGLVSLPIILL